VDDEKKAMVFMRRGIFAPTIAGLSIPGSLYAELRDRGGPGGTDFVSFADSVRAGSANEGTGTPSASKPRLIGIGIMPLLGLSRATGDEYVHYLQAPAMIAYRWTFTEKDEVTGELIPKTSGIAY
jgi:hypothetical protein